MKTRSDTEAQDNWEVANYSSLLLVNVLWFLIPKLQYYSREKIRVFNKSSVYMVGYTYLCVPLSAVALKLSEVYNICKEHLR